MRVNITPPERAGRILVGCSGVINGILLLGSASGAGIVVLALLLVAAGAAILFALVCLAMMGAMTLAMSGGSDDERRAGR